MPDSIYKQTLDNVQTLIAGLSLSGMNSTSIVVRKLPWDDNMIHRGITISWSSPRWGARLYERTNERDIVCYPCHVTIVEGTAKGWTDQLNRISDRQQKIRRTFHNKRPLTTVSDTSVNMIICKVTHGELTIPQKYLDNYDVTQMTILAYFLEPRDNS